MNLRFVKLVAIPGLLLGCSSFVEPSAGSLRGLAQDEPLICRVSTIETMMMMNGNMAEFGEVGCIQIKDGMETDILLPVELPNDLFVQYESKISMGMLFVSITGATLGDHKIHLSDDAKFTVLDEPPSHLRHLVQLPQQPFGTKTLLIVRVTSSDGVTPDKSLSQLRQGLFGSGTTFKTQYESCSFGKLRWVDVGGAEIRLDKPISAYSSSGQIVNDASAKLAAKYGVRSAGELADKVVFCEPPGTGNWIGVAGVNHWRANLNSGWCLSLSAVMHEVGHTLGLQHSGQEMEMYGDESGYMGYGDRLENYPRKCFNGHKSWQLGWYDDRVLEVDPSTPVKIKLAAFVDYDKTRPDEPVLLNIGNKFFFQYNRAKAFNADTEEGANKVTVTRPVNYGSKRLDSLDVSEKFRVSDWGGTGKPMVVYICGKGNTGGSRAVDYAIVSIGLGGTYCNL